MRATYAEVGFAVPSLPDSAPSSRLQRDPRFGSGNVRIYIPLASMLLISVALTLISALLRRLR